MGLAMDFRFERRNESMPDPHHINAQLSGFTTLRRFVLELDEVHEVPVITLTLENPQAPDMGLRLLRILGAQAIRLGGSRGACMYLAGLYVTTFHNFLFDRIRYRIEDVEDGDFRCECEDVTIEVVRPA